MSVACKNISLIPFAFLNIALLLFVLDISKKLDVLNQRLHEGSLISKLDLSSPKEKALELVPEVNSATIELYQNQSKIRKRKLETFVESDEWLVLYNVLVPEVFCKDLVRIGNVNDGGKWVCNPVRMRDFNDCVVYSVGINNDPSFEEEFAKFTNEKCLIRSIDKDDQKLDTLERIQNSNGVFMKAFMTPETNQIKGFYTMKSLMEVFDDKKVDILKMDIEGFEYNIIDHLLTISMCQILMEIHGSDAKKTLELLQKISQKGYYLFSYEINGAHHTLSEYSFIHERCLKDYGVSIIFGRYLS